MSHELDILPVKLDPNRPNYREVHPNLISPPFRWAIIGSSKSGKSNYLMNLLRSEFYGGDSKKGIQPCFTRIIVFSPNLGSDSTTRHLSEIVREGDMHQTYSDSIIQGIIEEQKARENDPQKERVLIIADDLLAMGCSPRSLIFTSSSFLRHVDSSLIYISQTYKGNFSLPPVTRNNLDALTMFRCPSAQQVNAFCEDMAGTFGTKKNVENMLAYCTQKPYHFCHLNYRDLKVFHNHGEFIWEKYDANGNFNADFNGKPVAVIDNKEEESDFTESEDEE